MGKSKLLVVAGNPATPFTANVNIPFVADRAVIRQVGMNIAAAGANPGTGFLVYSDVGPDSLMCVVKDCVQLNSPNIHIPVNNLTGDMTFNFQVLTAAAAGFPAASEFLMVLELKAKK